MCLPALPPKFQRSLDRLSVAQQLVELMKEHRRDFLTTPGLRKGPIGGEVMITYLNDRSVATASAFRFPTPRSSSVANINRPIDLSAALSRVGE